ncbi:MAG TPA: ferritin family protein [Candidatus Binatia bacterium]|nr:ferritin family protein [Candidatus Binatia bacterium]
MGLLSRLLGTGTARDLVADLAEDYRAEATQAALLRAYAERARYPQMAEALRRLAEVEERHASWLRDRLLTLGAAVPAVDAQPKPGQNQWARVVAAHEAAQRKRRRLVEQIAHWDPEEPTVVEMLARIEHEDAQQFSAYDHLIMRSDPQALD